VNWRDAAPGVDWAELPISGAGEAWRLHVILVRIDPKAVEFRLVRPPRHSDGYSGRWSVHDAPPDAIVAVNAGQFTGGPWGWIVTEGIERQPPGTGALAPGVAFTRHGRVLLLPPDSLASAEEVREAFQSYPTLLANDGDVPQALREAGLGVDLRHRDARLAFGLLRDGKVLLALTRFEGLGGVLEVIPFGLTTPEMAALMGALGCARAVLLDGGISGQLLVLEGGQPRSWPGLRKVAAGLVVLPRRAEAKPSP
jgi:exopolysaccharide biosynthesis protein